MQCPNCGDPNYQQGGKCAACGFEPLNDPHVLEKGREQRATEEKEEFNTNLIVGAIALAFFLFVFWFFPSGKKSSDWFTLTFWETIWAVGLGVAAFTISFKKH